MNARAIAAALGAFLLCSASAASAHKPSDSYLALEVHQEVISGKWDISLRDADAALGLDDDGDGAVTWGELRRKEPALFSWALARLQLTTGNGPCPTSAGPLLVDAHSDGGYAVLRFTARCPAPIDALEVRYSLLWDQDPLHRGLLRFTSAGSTQTAVFSPDRPVQRFEVAGGGGLHQLAAFVSDGVRHIWTGFDHVLFLLALLLPAVLRRDGPRAWVPVPRFRPALVEVLKVVSSFTLAHSITLSLATLGAVRLPSRLVESAIALSVLLAALNNLWPLLRGRQWAFAFGFGLLHGFGFAGALADLQLPRTALARALLGFNLGVELGQLAIVAAFLTLAYAARSTWVYRRVAFSAGSVGIAALSLAWLVERAFDVRLPFIS